MVGDSYKKFSALAARILFCDEVILADDISYDGINIT